MILVSGNGNLAKELTNLCSLSLPVTMLPRRVMDITNEHMVSDVIKNFMMTPDYPKYFIHTAALTKPMDVNDRNPLMSLDTNIVGTANVARVCSKYGIKFIYISTDFVYGDSELVDENSQVKPTNNYGWSKLGGECITKLISNSLILRCSLCDIPFRHKFAFEDVYRNSITHTDVADIIVKIKDEVGIINVGGEYQSVYDFVSKHQKIKKASGSHLAPSLNLSVDKLMSIIDE